jgi:hypothetical protein
VVTASLSWTLQKRMSMGSTTNIIGRQKWLMILMVVGFGRKRNLAVPYTGMHTFLHSLRYVDFNLHYYNFPKSCIAQQ